MRIIQKNTGDLLQDSGSNLSQVNDKVYNTAKTDSVASSLQDAGAQLQKLNDLAENNPTFKTFLADNPSIALRVIMIGGAAKKRLTQCW